MSEEMRLNFRSAEQIKDGSKLQCGGEGLVWNSLANMPHGSKSCMLRNSQRVYPGSGVCCVGEAMLPWGNLPCAF